jgi:hypothetical protein
MKLYKVYSSVDDYLNDTANYFYLKNPTEERLEEFRKNNCLINGPVSTLIIRTGKKIK